MKNFSQKTVSVLIWCTLIFLYAYSKTYKSNKKEVYDIKPKYVNSLKESDCYASEDDKDFAAGFKHGIIEKCKKLSKETPMRLDDSFVLKRIDVTEQLITYLYQFEFDKSEVSEEEWKDFLEESKKEIMTNLLTVTSETRKEFNISLSKTLELADIRLEYIYSDINDSIIGAIKLDHFDFYGM